MARPKKKTTKRPAKKAAKKATKKPAARRTRAAKPASRGRKAASPSRGGTDVERRWREYWQHRTDLEAAVEAVRTAEETLGEARLLEHKRREIFEAAKASLQNLLEVEPASAKASDRRLLDFPAGDKAPAADRPKPPEDRSSRS